MTDAPRPFLLLDVDGPLNPYAAKRTRRPEGYRTHRMRPTGWDDPALKPLRVWLNPDHGPALTALPYDLVWCTTWTDEANEWIGPQLGLPNLPHIPFDRTASREREDGTFWKTWDVVRWADGLPFAWVDDETTDVDRAFVARVHPAPALLLTISPRTGLLPEHFAELTAWAEALAPAAAQLRPAP